MALGLALSTNTFKASDAVIDGTNLMVDQDYFATDLNIKYQFVKKYTEKFELSRFDIYVQGGLGMFKINESGATANFGGGLTYWLSPSLGINVESVGKWTLESDPAQFDTNHFQHFLGLAYRLSDKKDTDKDGIKDSEDVCPDVFGLAEFNGCPDSDNDGIKDSEDACPNEFGIKANKGCPIKDADKDGIVDADDNCPNVKGLASNNGCPEKDTDNDGVADKNDKCPNVKGLQSNNGCPEKDTDSVLDRNDDCPNVPGTVSNNGCPKQVTEHTIATLNSLAKTVYFETSQSIFTSDTYSRLNEVAELMKQYPQAKFNITGHTDSVGSSINNLRLSEARALAVKNYLVGRGVKLSNLTSAGFGESQPIASNVSREGRAKNRRVEIEIIK